MCDVSKRGGGAVSQKNIMGLGALLSWKAGFLSMDLYSFFLWCN